MAKKRSAKDQEKDLNNLRKEAEALGKSTRRANADILGSQLDINKAKELTLDLTAEINKLLREGNTESAEELRTAKSQILQLEAKIKRVNKIKQGFGDVNKELQGAVSKIQDFVKKLPGGGMLTKAFGIDELGKGVTKALNKSAAVFNKTGGSVQMAGAAFSRGLMAAINPITLIAAAAAGLVMVFLNFEKKAKGVAEATGLTLQQSKELYNQSKKAAMSFDLQLATSTDILNVQKATIKEFGIANMLTAKQAGNVAEIGKAFSIGAENAAAVTNEFMRMGLGGTEAANALQDVSADALKAGVSVGTVTADIAANAKDVAKFFGGNVKALQKAAVQAAKLGVSLKTMASVAEGLLKFEDSISAQFELQALTGKQMNFDSARQLALQGDIAGATKEVLGQVGSIAEFDNMSYLARKKLAAATGMSVDELQKSLTIQSKLGDLTADQQAAMANMGLSAAEIKSMSSEELKDRLAQQQATDKLSASFSAIKDDLTKALIPAGEALVKVFSALSPIFKALGFTLKLAFLPITLAHKAIEAFMKTGLVVKSIISAIGALLLNNYMMQKLGTKEQKQQFILGAQKKAQQMAQNALDFIGLGTKKAQGTEEKKSLVTRGLAFLKQTAINVAENAGLAITLAKNVALGIGNTLMTTGIGKALAGAAASMAKAVGSIFSTFAQIPFGIGIPIAIGTIAGAFGMYKKAQKTGDLSIDPNGGPVVASPREGGIFQGTKNDGVSMSPSHGANGGGGGGDGVVKALETTNALLRELISAGTVVEMDGRVVAQALRTTDSYRRR